MLLLSPEHMSEEHAASQVGRLDHDDVQAALWQLARSNCSVDGKSKKRGRKTRLSYLSYLNDVLALVEVTMRAVFALAQALSELQAHTSALACGLIVQFPFSRLCVEGAKTKELRKSRAPPSKVNRNFFILESATTTTFEVHADCTPNKARSCPRSAVGTVYLEGSYMVQEPQLTETLAKELCISLVALRKAYTQGYRHVWILSQPVHFKRTIPTPTISRSKSGAVIWCNVMVEPSKRMPHKDCVVARIRELLSLGT